LSHTILDDREENSVCAHCGDTHFYKSPTLQESIPYLQPELIESGKENFVGTIAGCDEHNLRRWFRKNNPLEEVVVLRQDYKTMLSGIRPQHFVRQP